MKNTSGFRNSISLGQRWPGGVLYYQIGDNRVKANDIRNALAEFSSRTGGCIKFVEGRGSGNYIRVFSGNGCYSSLGVTGGQQDLSLQEPGCGSKETRYRYYDFTI